MVRSETPRPPLLHGLPEAEVERLLAAATRRRFGRHEIVFHQGDPGDALHLIVRGRFAVQVLTERGEPAMLAVLAPGDIFGELALLRTDARRTATLLSLEQGETLTISRETLHTLRMAHPEVTEVLLGIVADKVSRYTGQLLEALYVPAELRVLRRLLELVEVFDGEAVPITQEELAGLAGTSRATVNRVLGQEQGRGTLRSSRGRIEVLDVERLRARSR